MNLVSLVLLCVIAAGSVTAEKASGAERPLLHPERNFLVFKKRPRPSQMPEVIRSAPTPISSSTTLITPGSALTNSTTAGRNLTVSGGNETSEVSRPCPTCTSVASDALSITSVVPLLIVGLIYLCLGVKIVIDCRHQSAKRYRRAHDDLMLVTTMQPSTVALPII